MVEPDVTILAVDDEQANNELVRRVLRDNAAYRVLLAGSGEEALVTLNSEHVDLLIVDQSMPSMTGVELVSQALNSDPKIAAIMVTAYPDLHEVTQARKQGVIMHMLAKPWKPEDMLNAVSHALSLRSMRTAVARLGQHDNER